MRTLYIRAHYVPPKGDDESGIKSIDVDAMHGIGDAS